MPDGEAGGVGFDGQPLAVPFEHGFPSGCNQSVTPDRTHGIDQGTFGLGDITSLMQKKSALIKLEGDGKRCTKSGHKFTCFVLLFCQELILPFQV